jgi:hypothetical protein
MTFEPGGAGATLAAQIYWMLTLSGTVLFSTQISPFIQFKVLIISTLHISEGRQVKKFTQGQPVCMWRRRNNHTRETLHLTPNPCCLLKRRTPCWPSFIKIIPHRCGPKLYFPPSTCWVVSLAAIVANRTIASYGRCAAFCGHTHSATGRWKGKDISLRWGKIFGFF